MPCLHHSDHLRHQIGSKWHNKMRGLVPKFIMLICLLHINYRPFDPCERVLTFLFNSCLNSAKIKFSVVIKRARPGKQISFEDVRNALLVAYSDGFLDDEEFLFLYDFYESVIPSYPYWDFDTFCLDSFHSCKCEAHFRVAKDDLLILLNALQLPATFKCPQGTVCSGMEGLCLMLKRLAYPCQYFDLILTFAHPIPEVCMTTNTVLDWIYNMHGFHLTSWNQRFLSPANLQEYANAIARQGSPLSNCCGFIDSTVHPICCPGENQHIVYNGHKRVDALKFHSVALPKGLIANLYGPVDGRRHDAGMLKDSGLLNDLQRVAFSPTGDVLCLYGDPAYPLRPHLMAPFRLREVSVFTENMEAFNEVMSSVRVSVEWLFGDVLNSFKFLDFKKNLKLGLSAIGKHYIVAALFRNIFTCLYGNTASTFFQLDPPTVQDYLM